MNFDNIILENEQKELLIKLVEASRKFSRSRRRKFIVVRRTDGDYLTHPGLSNGKKEIYYGDAEILADNGLINLSYGSRGSPLFDVTPKGFRYYEYLMEQMGQPLERVEKTIRMFIDSESFQSNYLAAYQKWSLAEKLLWKSDNQENYSAIGHYCREALQEFAEILVQRFGLDSELNDKAKTIGRIRAVIELESKKVADSHKRYLDRLLDLYDSVNSLVQRQEHGAIKEGDDLVWEDARKVVFAVLFIMYEIHKAIA